MKKLSPIVTTSQIKPKTTYRPFRELKESQIRYFIQYMEKTKRLLILSDTHRESITQLLDSAHQELRQIAKEIQIPSNLSADARARLSAFYKANPDV